MLLFATNLSRSLDLSYYTIYEKTHALKLCEACICYFISGQPTNYPSNLVTVFHPIAPGSNQQVAAGNQQPIFVAQQPQTSSADAASDPEINNKQQEAINAAKNAAYNEPQRENPPSYFND